MRGNAALTKVHVQGKSDDFIIFAESAKAVEDWKKDSSVPIAQVVSGFKIFVSHKQGNQGILDGASKAQLEDEFGTSKDDEVIKLMLEKGTVVSDENASRNGDRNITQGPSVGH